MVLNYVFVPKYQGSFLTKKLAHEGQQYFDETAKLLRKYDKNKFLKMN